MIAVDTVVVEEEAAAVMTDTRRCSDIGLISGFADCSSWLASGEGDRGLMIDCWRTFSRFFYRHVGRKGFFALLYQSSCFA